MRDAAQCFSEAAAAQAFVPLRQIEGYLGPGSEDGPHSHLTAPRQRRADALDTTSIKLRITPPILTSALFTFTYNRPSVSWIDFARATCFCCSVDSLAQAVIDL